ncbi:putative arabinose efflux permease, MFS family [Streptoalloteichus tenebrarius]|uniref:Arabinose efflux permease, MFS family n=1 Tax=Streptoalloteichus tenebrarius (strain ATCC 17920 / DSM 40477 / JCM 4838 / CBS 697.72 / NBRC 16177 / NCIMB 11028 / NRRL B-12390 / A12253. 1 / ISP 5477) TaxID=1933 RepID=A0ABT1HPU1_STRSD|nr:MFS transporter [Streptoalloteichus tenebrarius]MCP2257531.1 putative arabinose efflux permease, MFS family [Streptoalloteichus tenebrarius]
MNADRRPRPDTRPDHRSPRVRSLLAHRDFRLLWIGETTSQLGSAITGVALPLVAVVTLDADTFSVALLGAAAWLPWLVVGLPAGAWVDRLRRRPVMLTANLASALLLASVPVAAWLGLLTLGHLLTVALASGAAAVFFFTAYHAYLPTLLTPTDLVRGNATLQGGEQAAQVTGRGLGGLLAQVFGATAGLLADAVTFVVSSACLVAIRAQEPPPPGPAQATGLARQVREGLRFVAADPYLRAFTAFGATANFALQGYQAVQVVFLVREVGVSPGVVGVLVACASVGGVLGATVAHRVSRRFGTARGLLLCQLGTAPFGLLMAFTGAGSGLVLFVVGAFLVATGIVATNVIVGGFRQGYCPPTLLGRVVATTMFLNHSTIPVGAVVAGALGSTLGLRPTMGVLTGLLALSGLFLLGSPLRGRRDLPTSPPAVSVVG